MKPQSNPPLRSPSRYSLLLAAAAAGLLPLGAAPVAISNSSFDSDTRNPAAADGADFPADTTSNDIWRHWQRTENVGPVRIWNPGADGANTQGVLTYGFGGIAPEGDQVALVYSRYNDGPITTPPQWDGVNYFTAVAQLLNGDVPTTAAPFDPTKTYRLTAKVGKPIVFQSVTNNTPVDASAPRRPEKAMWHGYAVQLAVGGTNVPGARYAANVSGGTLVAQDSNSLVVPVDSFITSSVTYFPNPADVALTGDFLQVRLCALDNTADLNMTGYVAFDDVQLEEIAAPALAFWDLNDTTAGAGGSAPSGLWNGANLFWNATADGTGTAAAWTPGQTAVFSAGGDATGSYTVTVDGTQDIGGLAFKDGTVTLAGGTALQLTGVAMADVANGLTATIETPLTESSPGTQLAKSGLGTLVLSATNTYTGGSFVLDGTLQSGAANVFSDTSSVTVSGRASGTTTLNLNGFSDTIGGLVLGGTSATTAATVSTGAGTLTLGGDVSFANANGNGVNPLGATISGNLALGAAARNFLVNDSASTDADLTISADITGSVAMTKVGKGTLVLSGNNVGATGGLFLDEGVTQFESAAAINGTARDVTVTTPGVAAFGPSFGAGNIPAALANRIAASSDGIIVADNYTSTNFDFDASGLTGAYLGAISDLTYTGTLTPNGTTYRIGGGGGTLTIPGTNALTGGGKSVVIGGKVTLSGTNDFDGGTTLLGGTVFPAGPVVLSLGNDGVIGTGPLTFQAQPNASTVGVIQSTDATTRTLPNPIILNGGFNTGGTGNITFTDTTPIDLSVTRLFVIKNPVTTLAQGFTGAGGFTMDYTGPGTLVINGNNSYSGNTTVNGGTLILTGNNSTTGLINLSSRFGVPVGIVLGHDSALGTSTLQLSTAGVTVSAQGTRTITNAISANADFTIVGTDALTFSGTMTLNNNRIITNNNDTAATTLGAITGTNRNLTHAGAGNTIVSGDITTGTGQLIKNGSGTLTLQGINTYSGNTTVNDGTLALVGGSQNSAINVGGTALLGFTPGSPTTSTKALTLQAGAKIRIIGTPASSTLFTTSATITGTPELEIAIPGYELVVETGNTLKLVATIDPDYLAWSENFLPAVIGLPGDDFDGDGLTNDQERLFGLNPTSGTSVNPISIPLDPTAGTFSFTRRDPSLTGYDYAVFTSTDLQLWEEDTGAVLTPGAVVDQIQSVAVQLSGALLNEPKLFVRMRAGEAPPPPPLLSVDFEADNGGFTTSKVAGTDWAWGAPTSSGPGGTVNTGNGGSANCWGTNIGNPGYYVNPTTDSRLISPVINLNGVVGAQLSFAYAIDIPTGDSVVVRIFNADTNAEIVAGPFPLTLTDATEITSNWLNSGPHALPDGVPTDLSIRIVWSLTGTGGINADYMGLYIDDVVVGVP